MIQLFSQIANMLGKEAVKDFVVDNPAALTSLATPNYLHKLVWVKSEKNFFFLSSGNGATLSNWEKFAPTADNFVAPGYDSTKQYGLGSLVQYQGKLYMGNFSPIGTNSYPGVSTRWTLIGPGTAQGVGNSVSAKIFDIPINFQVGNVNDAQTVERLPNSGNESVYRLSHYLGTTKIMLASYVLREESKDWALVHHSVVDKDTIHIFIRGTGFPSVFLRLYVVPINSSDPDAPVVWAGNNTVVESSTITLQGVLFSIDDPDVTFEWNLFSGPPGSFLPPDQGGVDIENPNLLQTNVTGMVVGNDYVFKLTATDSKDNKYDSYIKVTARVAQKYDFTTFNNDGIDDLSIDINDQGVESYQFTLDTETLSHKIEDELASKEYTFLITAGDSTPKRVNFHSAETNTSQLLKKLNFTTAGSATFVGGGALSAYIVKREWDIQILNKSAKSIIGINSALDSKVVSINADSTSAQKLSDARNFRLTFDSNIYGKIYVYNAENSQLVFTSIINDQDYADIAVGDNYPDISRVEVYRRFRYQVVNSFDSTFTATVEVRGAKDQSSSNTVQGGAPGLFNVNYGESMIVYVSGVLNGGANQQGRVEVRQGSDIIATQSFMTGQVTVPINVSLTNTAVTSLSDFTIEIKSYGAPIANAGPDQNLNYGTTSATLTGSSGSAGTLSYQWSVLSYPGSTAPTITSATSATTTVNGLLEGATTFKLRVTNEDNDLFSEDNVIITVMSVAPTANAGTDQSIDVAALNFNLTGTYTGNIAQFLWTQVSGPNTANILSPNTASTNVAGFQAGVYVFNFKVTDVFNRTENDTVQVTVTSNSLNVNFSKTAQSVPGWLDVVGNPSTQDISVYDVSTGITISNNKDKWNAIGGEASSNVIGQPAGGSGIYPDDVIASGWFNQNTTYTLGDENLILSGFNPGQLVKLTFFGSVDQSTVPAASRVVSYVVVDANGQNWQPDLDVKGNILQTSVYDNMQADINGQIKVAVVKSTQDMPNHLIGYINALQIEKKLTIASIGKFNFSKTAQPVTGWTNIFGNPSTGVLQGTQSGSTITVKTLDFSPNKSWNPDSGGEASDDNIGAQPSGSPYAPMFPETVTKSGFYAWNGLGGDGMTNFGFGQYLVEISGLVPNKYYNVHIMSSVDSNINGTATTNVYFKDAIGVLRTIIDASDNKNQLTLAQRPADSDGKMFLSVTGKYSDSEYGYLNALIVEELSGTITLPATAVVSWNAPYSLTDEDALAGAQLPATYYQGSGPWPVIIELHDESQNGSASAGEVSAALKTIGIAKALSTGSSDWNEFIVLCPQKSSTGWTEDQIESIYQYAINSFNSDPNRIYLIGHGTGGAAAVRAIIDQTDQRYAAYACISGSITSDLTTDMATAVHGSTTPARFLHGRDDVAPYAPAELKNLFDQIVELDYVIPPEINIVNDKAHNIYDDLVINQTTAQFDVRRWFLKHNVDYDLTATAYTTDAENEIEIHTYLRSLNVVNELSPGTLKDDLMDRLDDVKTELRSYAEYYLVDFGATVEDSNNNPLGGSVVDSTTSEMKELLTGNQLVMTCSVKAAFDSVTSFGPGTGKFYGLNATFLESGFGITTTLASVFVDPLFSSTFDIYVYFADSTSSGTNNKANVSVIHNDGSTTVVGLNSTYNTNQVTKIENVKPATGSFTINFQLPSAGTAQVAGIMLVRKKISSEAQMFSSGGYEDNVYDPANNMKAWIYLPAGYDPEKPGGYDFILFLHGMGANQEPPYNGTLNKMLNLNEGLPGYLYRNVYSFDSIMIAPQLKEGQWTDSSVALALAWAGAGYNLSSNGKYVTGFSSGGRGSTAVLLSQPTTFGASLPISATESEITGDISKAATTPLRFVHGAADTQVPPSGPQKIQAIVDQLNQLATKPIFPPEMLVVWYGSHDSSNMTFTIPWRKDVYNKATAKFDFEHWFKKHRSNLNDTIENYVTEAETTKTFIDWSKARSLVEKMSSSSEKTAFQARLSSLYTTMTGAGKSRFWFVNLASTETGHFFTVNNVPDCTPGLPALTLKDTSNNTTTATFRITAGPTGSEATNGYDNTYMGLSALMYKSSMSIPNGQNVVYEIGGLDPSKQYDIKVYHSNRYAWLSSPANSPQLNRPGFKMTIGDYYVQADETVWNTTQTCDYDLAAPDGSGKITITFQNLFMQGEDRLIGLLIRERKTTYVPTVAKYSFCKSPQAISGWTDVYGRPDLSVLTFNDVTSGWRLSTRGTGPNFWPYDTRPAYDHNNTAGPDAEVYPAFVPKAVGRSMMTMLHNGQRTRFTYINELYNIEIGDENGDDLPAGKYRVTIMGCTANTTNTDERTGTVYDVLIPGAGIKTAFSVNGYLATGFNDKDGGGNYVGRNFYGWFYDVPLDVWNTQNYFVFQGQMASPGKIKINFDCVRYGQATISWIIVERVNESTEY